MAYHPKWMIKPTYDANEDNLVDDADKVDGIEGTELLKRDGSTPMTGDLDMGTHSIKNAPDINGESGAGICIYGSSLSAQAHLCIYAKDHSTDPNKIRFVTYVAGVAKEPFVVESETDHPKFPNGLETDTISEATADAGVTIDGCLIKDGKAAEADKVDGADAGAGAGNVFLIPSDIQHGDIFFVNSAGNLTRLPAGTAGQFLKTQGPGADPVWAAPPAGWTIKNVNANYTASDGEIVLVDASGGAVTITLPTPSASARVRVKKIDASSNVVTVQPSGSETIDGASSHTISQQYETYEYVSDGTNWYVF